MHFVLLPLSLTSSMFSLTFNIFGNFEQVFTCWYTIIFGGVNFLAYETLHAIIPLVPEVWKK